MIFQNFLGQGGKAQVKQGKQLIHMLFINFVLIGFCHVKLWVFSLYVYAVFRYTASQQRALIPDPVVLATAVNILN